MFNRHRYHALIEILRPDKAFHKARKSQVLRGLRNIQNTNRGPIELKKHEWKNKGGKSRLAHLEKLSLNLSSSSIVIRVNLLHFELSLFLFGYSYVFYLSKLLFTGFHQLSFFDQETTQALVST